jgi:hypothetical protein
MARLVLRAIAVSEASTPETNLFRLTEIATPALLLLTPDRRQHLLFHDGVRSLQLAVDGASLLKPVRLMTDVIFDPKDISARFEAIETLNDLRHTGGLIGRHFPPERRAVRLRIVLRALDASLSGATRRDTAEALFGRSRVHADWNDPRGHLRDHIRRAVRRGRHLMQGGYRQFLE